MKQDLLDPVPGEPSRAGGIGKAAGSGGTRDCQRGSLLCFGALGLVWFQML